MWMYDLTGGARIGKLHKRLDVAETLALHADAAGRSPGGRLPLLRRLRRRRPPHADRSLRTAALDHGAVVANGVAVDGLSKDGDRQGHRRRAFAPPRATPSTIRAGVVVNAAGVWSDDVRALDEGSHPDSIRPAKGIHVTVPWSLVRNTHRRRRARAEGQAVGVRRAVGRRARAASRASPTSARPTPTTTVPSTIRSARPTTSSTSCGPSTSPSPAAASRPTTCSARWAGLRPLVKSAATAAPPTCPRGHRVSDVRSAAWSP